MDCSMALHIKAFVNPFKSLFFIYRHVLFVSVFSISLANCPCILLAVCSFFLCSSVVFLNSLGSNFSLFVIVLLDLFFFLFFLLGFTSCKVEQPLQGMELQEKNHKKDYKIQKICLERIYN